MFARCLTSGPIGLSLVPPEPKETAKVVYVISGALTARVAMTALQNPLAASSTEPALCRISPSKVPPHRPRRHRAKVMFDGAMRSGGSRLRRRNRSIADESLPEAHVSPRRCASAQRQHRSALRSAANAFAASCSSTS
jgi:hypothetical protein